jgi:hypothetical protein
VLTSSTRVVVPLDGSEFSTRAIPAAGVIARAAGTGITLLGVAEGDAEATALAQHLHTAAAQLAPAADVTEELVATEDPVSTLLRINADPDRVLLLATHDRMPPSAAVLRSVGSRVIERAGQRLFVVGPSASPIAIGSDVAVALDGRHDPEPLLTAAVACATFLDASLRVVTVYEPVLADIRDPEHFTRERGPATDPDVYLRRVGEGLDERVPRGVEFAAIPDAVSAAAGLSHHLAERPPLTLVAGGRHHPDVFGPGVIRALLRTLAVPILLEPVTAANDTAVLDRASARAEGSDT